MSDPSAGPVRVLPDNPHPDFYRRDAKALLKAAQAGDVAALGRFRAHHPKGEAGAEALHDAQWVVAREHGYRSWPSFIEAVTEAGAGGATFAEWLDAALWPGRLAGAQAILRRNPRFATDDLVGACVAGDAAAAARHLAADAAAARAPAGPRGWPPLLYLCFSRFLGDPARRPGLHEIARRLLALGADPNASWRNAGDEADEAALYGAAGIAGDAVLAAMLLEAGADPDDGETLYHVSELADRTCLALVLRHSRKPANVSYCLRRKLDFEDVEGARLFLDHGADPNVPGRGGTALHHAIDRGRSVAVIGLLLERGADPEAVDGAGISAYALARRLGRTDLADLMLAHGASGRLTPRDQALAELAAGGAGTVEPAADAGLLAVAVRNGDLTVTRRLLDAGFDIGVRHEGMEPLHWAAWFGNAAMVRLLLERGAPLEARNAYGGTPLGTAVYGSTHCHSPTGGSTAAGDAADPAREARYVEAVEALIAAGATVGPGMAGEGTPAVDALVRRALG